MKARRTAALFALALTAAACADNSPDLVTEAPASPEPSRTVGSEETAELDQAGRGAILVDSFTEAGPLSGATATLGWAIPSGDWRIVDGGVRHSGPIGTLPSVAVTETGSANGLIQATFTEPADWAGLTFRYTDLANYWTVIGAPNFGTWNLSKVVDGESIDLGNVGAAPVTPGTVLGILLDGDRISISINAQTLLVVIDATHAEATAAGLYAGQDTASNAIWDNFLVVPARPAEVTTKAASSPPQTAPTPTPGLGGFEIGTPTPLPGDNPTGPEHNEAEAGDAGDGQ